VFKCLIHRCQQWPPPAPDGSQEKEKKAQPPVSPLAYVVIFKGHFKPLLTFKSEKSGAKSQTGKVFVPANTV
jgi:hypothetical protein